MCTAGFAGEVLSRMGVVPQQLAGGDVYPVAGEGARWTRSSSSARTTTEVGFNKVAKYYYYPGWWEGGPQVSLYLNEGAWKACPRTTRPSSRAASRVAHVAMTSRLTAPQPARAAQADRRRRRVYAFPRSVRGRVPMRPP